MKSDWLADKTKKDKKNSLRPASTPPALRVPTRVKSLFFLPFWILALFGTCWRQCCCCCCDPIVLCGTLTDLIKVCTEHEHYSLFISIIFLWYKWVLNFGWWNNMQKDKILSYHVCMMKCWMVLAIYGFTHFSLEQSISLVVYTLCLSNTLLALTFTAPSTCKSAHFC